MNIEPFESDRDRAHVHRIWEEVGWLDPTNDGSVDGTNAVIDAGRAWVSRLNDEAECLVLCSEGTIRYLEEDIPFSGVTGVTTSRVGRKQGLAARLTSHAIAQEAKDGALVSGLGMFEQGFYNRLGFGTGHYENQVSFDPQMLTVPFQKRPPIRLTKDDFELMHTSRLGAKRHHGYVSFNHSGMTKASQCESKKSFGLGYTDDATGELTHHIWFGVIDAENGPYFVQWMAFHNRAQFLELMGVVRSLGDQVRKMTMVEPAHIQMQDLLREPMQNRMTTKGSKFETALRSLAWWQNRMNDIDGCLKQTHLEGDTIRFNLQVSDPIEDYLNSDESWRGVGGEYCVTLGAESSAKPGCDASLPTLITTVNAFTRFWLGNVTALGLTYTDSFEAPDSLILDLDRVMRLPVSGRDWQF